MTRRQFFALTAGAFAAALPIRLRPVRKSRTWYVRPLTHPNALTGKLITITSGPGKGQLRRIVSNTATTLTVALPWETQPAADSTCTIEWEGPYRLTLQDAIRHAKRGDTILVGNGCYLS